MKTPKTLLAAGAITAFSFGLAYGAEQQSREVGATERDTQTRIEIEQKEADSAQQQQDQQEFGARPEARDQQQQAAVQQDQKSHKASDLKGSRVQSQDGERLGTVDDLAVDLKSGKLSYIIVSSGGFLGIGGDLHPVPPEAVEIREVDLGIELVLDVDQQKWENAPTIEREQIAQLEQQTQSREIQEFYGTKGGGKQQMEFGAPEREEGQQLEQQQKSESLQQSGATQHPDQKQSTGLGAQQSSGLEQEQQREFGAAQRDQKQEAKAEKHEEKAQVHEERAEAHEARAEQQESQQQFGAAQRQEQQLSDGQIRLASDLMDTEVTNSQQQTLGQIDDFIVNTDEGQIDFVLLIPDTGFWATADETYAIAPQAFHVSAEDQIILNITQQDLEQAQTVSKENIQQHAKEARMAGAEARQQPQVFRYQEEESQGALFGGREEESQSEAKSQQDTTASPQERSQEKDSQTQSY